MNYQDILGRCSETAVSQLASRCPGTLDVFRRYVPHIDNHRQATVEMVASIANVEPGQLCQELFDTVMEQTSVAELDTDVLLALILRGYHRPNERRTFNHQKTTEKAPRHDPKLPGTGVCMSFMETFLP